MIEFRQAPNPRITIAIRQTPQPDVSIELGLPDPSTRLLVGKEPGTAVALVPHIYAICSHAHGAAAATALANAERRPIAPSLVAARELLVAMEALREGMLRVGLVWSELAGEAPNAEALRPALTLVARLRETLFGAQNPFAGHAVPHYAADETANLIAEADALLRTTVLGEAPRDWLRRDTLPRIADWASRRTTAAARLFDAVLQNGWADEAKVSRTALDTAALDRLALSLSHDCSVSDALAAMAPLLPETHLLDRFEGRGLSMLQDDDAPGLLTRMVALLRAIACLPDAMRSVAGSGFSPSLRLPSLDAPGFGFAAAWSPRGALIHALRLQDGRIARYDVIQPTRLNFAADGVAARALRKLATSEPLGSAHLPRKARLVIAAIDPCVPSELRVC